MMGADEDDVKSKLGRALPYRRGVFAYSYGEADLLSKKLAHIRKRSAARPVLSGSVSYGSMSARR